MPVKVINRGGNFRIVEADSGKVAKTDNGVPRDGGGHATLAKASRQAAYINQALREKAGK